MKQIALKFTFILRDEKFDSLLSNNGFLSYNEKLLRNGALWV